MDNLENQKLTIKKHQGTAPVQVVPIATDFGLEVFKVPDFPKNLSGMIRRTPDNSGKFAIYVNATHGVNRRRFTIAHEIGHFVLHRELIGDGIVDDAMYRSGISNKAEAQANRLAADILMPWHLLDPIISGGITDVSELATKFQVSASSMAIRLGVPYED